MPGMSCCGGGCDHLARGLPMHPVLAKAQAALASAAPSEAAPAGPDKDLVTACEHVLSEDADISKIDFNGRYVLLRCDLNVPLREGPEGGFVIRDDSRARLSLPTLDCLLHGGARVAVFSHLGRPEPGTHAAAFSLRPVADFFARERPAAFRGFVDDCVGPAVHAAVTQLQAGEFVVLENTRFHAGDEANDEAFARALLDASRADVVVLDAFGAAHRAHASVSGIASLAAEAYPGLLLRQEVRFLTAAMWKAQRPFCCVVGGAKVADKIGVLKALIDIADCILLGGRMAFTFLAAEGIHVGQTLVEVDKVGLAREILDKAVKRGVRFLLPVDVMAGDTLEEGAKTEVVRVYPGCCGPDSPCVRPGLYGGDVGPETAELYARSLQTCRTIFWNGPMGKFEVGVYEGGTQAVLRAVAEGKARGAVTIVGGGDSAAAVEQCGCGRQFSHISTGGGASLELIEGRGMPGIRALHRTRQ